LRIHGIRLLHCIKKVVGVGPPTLGGFSAIHTTGFGREFVANFKNLSNFGRVVTNGPWSVVNVAQIPKLETCNLKRRSKKGSS
jgi:hypothetical protein